MKITMDDYKSLHPVERVMLDNWLRDENLLDNGGCFAFTYDSATPDIVRIETYAQDANGKIRVDRTHGDVKLCVQIKDMPIKNPPPLPVEWAIVDLRDEVSQ